MSLHPGKEMSDQMVLRPLSIQNFQDPWDHLLEGHDGSDGGGGHRSEGLTLLNKVGEDGRRSQLTCLAPLEMP